MAFDADDLSPVESHVIDRTREGQLADLAPMLGPDGVKPLLRAGFLRKLLIGLNPEWPVRMPGVRIRGARIEGVLDLSDCAGAGGAGLPALELIECDLPQPIDLSHARLARLSLDGAALTKLSARHARFDGPVSIRGVHAIDAICALDFEAAQIDGAFDAKDAQLACDPSEPAADGIGVFALNLRNARIGASLALRPGFVALGGVSLYGAKIAGAADLRAARLTRNHRYALSAGNLELGGALRLNAGFRAEGPIWLRGARLGDGLHADGGAIVLDDPRRPLDALNAEGADIAGGASFRNGFLSNATLNLRGAHIRGGIDLSKAALSSAKAALDLRNAVIDGDVFGAMVAKAPVLIAGAAIARNLDLRGAEIFGLPSKGHAGPDFERALDATNVRVGGGVFFQNAKIRGELLLADARIDGYCAFGGGRFLNGAGWAIRAPNLRVGGNLTFKSNGADAEEGPVAAKTVIEGGAKFDRARIDGELAWDGLELRGKSEGGTPCALTFADAEIGRALAARALSSQQALIDLTGARCAALEDDLAKGWGLASTQIAFEGFAYGRLDCTPEDMRWSARTRWIRERAARRSAAPYSALARVYAESGRQEDMRRALRAQHEAEQRSSAFLSPTRLFSAAFGAVAGYGLSPTRAVVTLLLFLLLGIGGVFAMDSRGALVRADGHACAGAVEPVLYAIDVALPIIDLHQETACAPGAAPDSRLLPGVKIAHVRWRIGEEVALWRWAQAAYAMLGALLAALAVLTFSGVMKNASRD